MPDYDMPDRFRDAMAPLASSVTVVTTEGVDGRAGVTVSTMCSLSLEPPSVIVCVHNMSQALNPILGNGHFAANVLAEDQSRVAMAFAGQLEEFRHDRFGIADWGQLVTGAPVLPGAMAIFDCNLVDRKPFGSHVILIGEVIEVASNAVSPLVYSDRSFKKLKAA